MDENGRMLLNGIPTNIQSGQRYNTPHETEVFQTPPPTPRQQPVLDVEDEGVIHLNRILPLDPAYEDLMDLLPCGKPRPPHDFDQDVLMEESPLNQWLLDGSSRRSHHHWKQVYQYYQRHTPTPSIRRWEEQFLQVLRGLNLACSTYGKLLLNGVHSTLARLNEKKLAIEQIETKYKGSTSESQFYPELESHICTWLGNQLSDAIKRKGKQ